MRMKKKLSLILVALVAIAAFALQASRRGGVELVAISESTTWDFSKLTIITTSPNYDSGDDAIKLSGETVPTNTVDVLYEARKGKDYDIADGFNGNTISFKGQYPIRKNKFAQNGTLHIKTTVPGTLQVSFSDTGSSPSASAVKRYLVVNGVQTEYWSSRPNNGDNPYDGQLNVVSGEIEVPAGDVTIAGTSAIQVSKVVFTAASSGEGGTEEAIYSWESPAGTPVEKGGTIAYVNGDGDRLNYKSGDYYTICLNGKKANLDDATASANAGHMEVTLDEPLQAGDVVKIKAFISKNSSAKSSAWVVFEDGSSADSGEFGDEANIHESFSGTPQEKTITVTSASAGSKSFKMTRGSTGTNLFIIKLEVTRVTSGGGDEPSSNAIVYDFAAAAAAGENPDNFNYGSAFYAWESDEKADSRRQDYRGYTNYAGSNLPAECHFFRRTDRINGNIGDGGLKCPNNRECVIDGIEAGKKVIITYNADNATTKTILWTSATGEGHTTKATLGKSSRVCISGKSEIASNAVIHIRETECGYFSFRVMKGMVIEKIVIDDDDSGDEVLPAYQTTFDFNSLTSFDLNAEVTTKIADLEIFDEVTETKMTVSDSGDAEAPNRFVESEESGLIQLEVNGGTLVFDAPTEDHSIKKISFFYHTWDEGNTAETGEVKAAAQRRADEESDEPVDPAALTGFTVDAEKQTATWAGSAQKVIVTIAGKTIINKITVEVGERKGEKLVMDVPSGSDLGKVVEDIFKGNPYVGSITLNLAKDGKYTSSKPMYTSKPLIINGAEGAVIDASGNEESFIQMMTLPELGLNEAGAYPIDEITIKDVQIKGLKNRLFYAARQKYLISKMTVENSILGFDAKVPRTIFDFYCGGNTAELIIKNSTLWANPANTHRGGLFSSQASQDVPSLGGPESQKFIFENNTFYNIAYGVTPMLHRDHSRYWLSFELKENVIVNCGEPGKFVLGMNEGQPGEECIWYVEGNSFTFDGQSTNNDEAYVMRPVMGGIEFANADKGDFALSVLDEAFDAGIGDPRWLTGTEGELFVDLPTGKDIAAEVAAAKGDKKVTNILVRLAKDGQYTMSGTIEASASVGIIGDEAGIATIDASASEAPFLTLAGTETPAKNADGTENASYKYINLISISNLKINGLKQALVRDTQKTYVGRLLVNNDVINVEGSANIFDFNGQGYPATLLVNNSTLWSKDGHTGYLLQSSGRVRDLDSDQKSYTQNIVVGFSTLYKISVGKQLNNLQGKGQKSLVLWLTYSIVAESTQAGNEVRGWLGGQNSTNPVVLYYANSYWADGAVQAGWTDSSKQGYDDSESSIEGDPQFKNPAEGDFTLGASTKQTQLKVGDPRWLVEYDPTTAIEAVERAKETVSDGAWYTLQGVRVDKPAKGVYIHNGKKVVVK